MCATVNHFYPALLPTQIPAKKRQICDWLRQRELIIDKCETGCGSQCKDRILGMSVTLPPEFEEAIVRRINSLRKEGVPVTGTMVRIHAKDCYISSGLPAEKFAASQSWLLHFLRRNRFSIRRRTRQSQKTPEDSAAQAEKFGEEVQAKMKELGVDRVFNADQTAINYEYLPTQTIAATGSKTVWMKSAVKDKERITLMVSGDSTGQKYDHTISWFLKQRIDDSRASSGKYGVPTWLPGLIVA